MVDEVRNDGELLVSVRNRLKSGDQVEFIGPGMRADSLLLHRFTLIPDVGAPRAVEVANPNSRILLKVPFAVQAGDLLRREKV